MNLILLVDRQELRRQQLMMRTLPRTPSGDIERPAVLTIAHSTLLRLLLLLLLGMELRLLMVLLRMLVATGLREFPRGSLTLRMRGVGIVILRGVIRE